MLSGGCLPGSPQAEWLREDLAEHPAQCTAAVIHAPLFSSGNVHGPVFDMIPFWQALYDAGAEVVVSGDDHVYERFAPQSPGGALDEEHGIRQFVAGMGGRSHYGFNTPLPNSQVRNANTYGILQLKLHPDSYDFSFVPEAGGAFTDSGSTSCHDDPPPAPTITFPAPDSTLNYATPYLEGVASMGPNHSSEVTVNIYAGTSATGTPVTTLTSPVASDGTWIAQSAEELPDGRYTAEVVQTATTGETGTSAPRVIRFDATAPQPALTTPADGANTDDRTPTSPGPAEPRWGITRPCRSPSTPGPKPRARRSRLSRPR